MNILIGGIPRSGSTRLFNLVRLLALQNYSVSDVCSGIWTKLWKNKAEINICKSHECYEEAYEWADFVFVAKRNWMEIAASNLDFMNTVNRDLKKVGYFVEEICIKHDKSWENKHDLLIEFSLYEKENKNYIANIANLLNCKYDAIEIIDTLEKYKKREIVSKDTLMFSHHVSQHTNKSAKDRMSEEEYKFFEEVFKRHSIVY